MSFAKLELFVKRYGYNWFIMIEREEFKIKYKEKEKDEEQNFCYELIKGDIEAFNDEDFPYIRFNYYQIISPFECFVKEIKIFFDDYQNVQLVERHLRKALKSYRD